MHSMFTMPMPYLLLPCLNNKLSLLPLWGLCFYVCELCCQNYVWTYVLWLNSLNLYDGMMEPETLVLLLLASTCYISSCNVCMMVCLSSVWLMSSDGCDGWCLLIQSCGWWTLRCMCISVCMWPIMEICAAVIIECKDISWWSARYICIQSNTQVNCHIMLYDASVCHKRLLHFIKWVQNMTKP